MSNLYRAALYKSVLVLYKCQVKERAVILNGQFLLYFKSLVNKMCYGALKSNIDRGLRSYGLGQYCFSVLHNTSYYIYGFMQYSETIWFVFWDKLSYCTAGFHIERSMDVNNSRIHDTVGNQHIFQNQQTMNMSMMSVPSTPVIYNYGTLTFNYSKWFL